MIRKITKEDETIFYYMAKLFYSSDAVLHSVPQQHHVKAFQEMMRSTIYVEGYILEYNGKPAGYAMTSKMYSQEAGGIILWIDELFVLKEYRSKGLGTEFLSYIKDTMDSSIVRLRLEVEEDNDIAKTLYEKAGFNKLAYEQMVLDKI